MFMSGVAKNTVSCWKILVFAEQRKSKLLTSLSETWLFVNVILFLFLLIKKKKTKHDYFFLCSFLFLVGKKQQGKLNRKG